MRKHRVEMQYTNEIKLEQRGSVTLLDIQGDITGFSEPFLNEAYKNADNQGASNILLKTERDIYINSGGIAVLIQIPAQTKQSADRYYRPLRSFQKNLSDGRHY